MSKLQIVSLQKKSDLTKPDEAKPSDLLALSMPLPIQKSPKAERTNYWRVKSELDDLEDSEREERKKSQAEHFLAWKQKRRRMIVRHNMHRDGILLTNWKAVLDWNQKCKDLAWRLATTPGGKSDPDWYPTLQALQNARNKRDKLINKQEKEWEANKRGEGWKRQQDKEAADRHRKLQAEQRKARERRRKALQQASRLDLLEHEKRLLQMELAASKAKNTQWARVEEGRKRFMAAHGKALEVPGATSES